MNLPLEGGRRERGRAGGWLVSIGVHLVLFGCLFMLRIAPVEAVQRWVEMAVSEPQPPKPEPPKPPEPEPPKPKKRVAVQMPVTLPEPDVLPPPERPTQSLRRVQGLDPNSFAKGPGVGITARAGTSLTTKAGPETMTPAEAAVSWAAASVAPRCPKPALTTPDAVKAAHLQGTVEVLLDVEADGSIGELHVTRSLSPEADAACLAAWRTVRCTPGRQGDAPVAVTGLPHACTFRLVE